MALPPTIPTSFVPRLGSSTRVSARLESVSILGILAYVLLGVVCVLALGVFFYGRILISAQGNAQEELALVHGKIDPATIEGFVHLHNRLASSKTLLANHPAFSSAFNLFESITPTKVRFVSLRLALQEDGSARVEGAGTAQSFNVLAATSQMFAADTRVKNVVFSNIRAGKDGSVSFSLSAKIDKRNLAFKIEEATPTSTTSPL
jgi:Fe-S-cluster formation regulator IscX/YfhJ